MSNHSEERDVYIIPQNFIEDGKIAGGALRLRNAFEAGILAIATGYPILKLPLQLYPRVIILCLVTLPLTLLGLIGIGDDSLSEFVLHFFSWIRKRRILSDDPEQTRQINSLLGQFAESVGSLFKKIRAKLPFKEVEADEQAYEIIYYDSEDEIPEEALSGGEFKNAERSTRPRPSAPSRYKPEEAQSIQDFLPIERIENGIVQTKDGRYIKILEVEPINFLLRGAREQRGIIYSFASLLKISPIKLQFKCISRKADTSKHLQNIQECMRKEKDPRCRSLQQDYFNLVRRIGSKEAVTRRFFMIFEYEHPLGNKKVKYQEVQAMLETTARNAKSFLQQSGNDIVEHENEDEFLSDIFYGLFNRRTSVDVPIGDRAAKVIGSYIMGDDPQKLDDLPISELIAPPSIDFSHIRYIEMDGLYYSYLTIPSDAFKVQVMAGWLSIIVNAGEGIDADLYLFEQPKQKVQQKIGQRIRINRSKIKDTSDTNTDFDDLSNAIQSGYFLKRGIANNEDFYYMGLLITVTAETVKDLEWRVGEMRKLLISQDMDARVCSFQQEQAFLMSLPLAAVDKQLWPKMRRNVLTTGAASCYPFTSYELSDDNGILLGVNKYNNSMVIADLFNAKIYKSPNMAICGCTGSGKTFTMQLLALRLRQRGIQVFILAPIKGHEFRRACANIGGEFIQISPSSPHCINVMEIRKTDTSASDLLDGPQTERSELASKIQTLHSFFSLLVPDMSYEERQLLDEAIVRTYKQKGITHDNASLIDPNHPERYKEMPILGDLYAILKQTPETRRLANIINRLVNGSASTFNQATNVNLENLYTVLDISELTGDLVTAGMFLALDYVWSKVKEDRTKEKMIFIPELWKLIGSGSNKEVATIVLEIFKVIRGYGGGCVADTQDISDFLSLDDGKYGRGILNACKTKIILNMEDDEARKVQDILHLTETEIMNITHYSRGSGLISTNNNNVSVEFKCSPLELELITSDREELRSILERRRAQNASTGEAAVDLQ